jgi:hypothetical protein
MSYSTELVIHLEFELLVHLLTSFLVILQAHSHTLVKHCVLGLCILQFSQVIITNSKSQYVLVSQTKSAKDAGAATILFLVSLP